MSETIKVGNIEIITGDLYVPEDFSIRTTKDVIEFFLEEVNYKLGELTEEVIKSGPNANISVVIDLDDLIENNNDDYVMEDITKEICDTVCEIFTIAGWPAVIWSGDDKLTFTFYFNTHNSNINL